MKVFPIALADHYALGTRTLSQAIRVERNDGQVFAFTTAQTSVLIDGERYGRSGLTLSDVVTSSDMSVGNQDLTLVSPLGVGFLKADIFGGLWKNARFLIFEYNRFDPSAGKNPLVSGTFGEINIERGRVKVELRDLMQYLQQSIGEVSSKNCRNRLGDARCGVDLDLFTVTGSLTSVTSPQVFRDSARTEDEDWFGEGILTFTSGLCDGFSQKVKTYDADGTITLMLPMFSAVQAGDTYSMVAGCRKRHDRTAQNPSGASDCLDKFDNVPRFRGEPHRPGVDKISSAPEPVV